MNIHIDLKYVGAILVAFALFVVGFSTLQVQAAQGGNGNGSNKPLTLVDANGTELGTLVGASLDSFSFGNGGAPSYTTYVSSADGLLQFGRRSSGTELLLEGGRDFDVFYSQEDCQGQVYVDSNASEFLDPLWVIEVDGNTYKMSSSSQTLTLASSRLGVDGGSVCHNNSVPENLFHQFIPVTLPFNINTVAKPFSII